MIQQQLFFGLLKRPGRRKGEHAPNFLVVAHSQFSPGKRASIVPRNRSSALLNLVFTVERGTLSTSAISSSFISSSKRSVKTSRYITLRLSIDSPTPPVRSLATIRSIGAGSCD